MWGSSCAGVPGDPDFRFPRAAGYRDRLVFTVMKSTVAVSPSDRPTNTLVVGGGAVGSFLGTLLALAGHQVTLVRPYGPGRGRGPIGLIAPDGARREVVVGRILRTKDAPPPDLIVVGVKMAILGQALAPAKRWPKVPTLTVQNGIGAEETVAQLRPDAPRLAASLTAAIELTPQDEVHWLSRGGLGLAAVNAEARPILAKVAGDLRRAGLQTAILPDYRSMKWSKVLANQIANASSAILDIDPAAIYRDPRLFALERRMLLETLAVMRAQGLRPVTLPGAPIPWLARAVRLPARLGRPILRRIVGGARGGKLPSLRLHVRSAGRGPAAEPTEAAWLYGAVAHAGERVGVAAPVNARLAALVDEVAMQPDRRAWLRGHPERLLAELGRI
jgi:2-dehydropantoate 2-reductase